MNNPILLNYRTHLLYTSIWIFITSIQILVLLLGFHLPAQYLITDCILSNILLAVFVILLWYPFYFSQQKQQISYRILTTIGLCIAFVSIWIATYAVVLNMLFSNHTDFTEYFKATFSWKIIEGVFIYILSILSYYLYLYTSQLKEKTNNELQLNKLLKDQELSLLKSKINPHFLFNSLNSVNALILQNPEQAREMLIALSEYLRHTVLSINQEKSTLKNEIENIEKYLTIEKYRFGNKLVYDFSISPDCLNLKMPSMLLQPLFENAVKHGVYESTEVVQIVVNAHTDSEYLYFEISNNFDEKYIAPKKGSGTGLKYIAERLYLSYGNSAALQTKVRDNLFIAILKIPATNSL